MKQWINNSKKVMAACGAVAVMLVAGWQFGVSGTEVPFSDNEVALENAIKGSCNPGHSSTGIQTWGTCGKRWDLCCDETTTAICCFS
ncbi:hypothetical protein [Lunatimonas salinarum]|uniref:hypothetical protein n=1 Tax=Lunatimonas salinarum TaxID=1774590 RepID=UPI001ADFEC4D|nr:hypothetical protein [Lunatimonas salinarum]